MYYDEKYCDKHEGNITWAFYPISTRLPVNPRAAALWFIAVSEVSVKLHLILCLWFLKLFCTFKWTCHIICTEKLHKWINSNQYYENIHHHHHPNYHRHCHHYQYHNHFHNFASQQEIGVKVQRSSDRQWQLRVWHIKAITFSFSIKIGLFMIPEGEIMWIGNCKQAQK